MSGPRRFRVEWSPVAGQDLESIAEFVSRDRPRAGEEILARFERAGANLCRLPHRGRIVPELREQGILLYREILLPPWRIVYRISGRTVYVLAVLDGRRDVEDLLLERLTRE